jgi:Ca-activated chloride channel homolog
VRLPAPALLAGLCLAAAVTASAQSPSPSPSASPSPSPPPFTVESDIAVVSVTAVVHDKAGRFVPGLGPRDIEVFEDGVRQDVSYFQEASGASDQKIPLSVVLALDSSGSMAKSMRFLREAAITFVRKLEDVDSGLIVQFNESVKGSAEFTGDVDRLEQFIESLQAWGGTALYDAIQYGLSRVRDKPGRKALIVFSDGADHNSSTTEQEVIDYARSVEATVYSILIHGEEGGFARSPRGFLRKIAQETGGAYFNPDKVGDLIKVFAGISDELHHHYALAYTPKKPPDGTWRDIEVRLIGHGDAQVRVRKGYFAVRRRKP